MGEVIMKSREEKDLGVIVKDSLSPEQHINGICGSTHRMLSNIRVAIHYMDKDMMKKIIATMILPRLEYAAVVWSPHKKKDVTKIERIQRAATKMVPELKDLTYEERLKEMELPTLQARRERGDLITMYKIGEVIMKSREERDLGVIVQDSLTPEQHINGICGSTHRILMNIRVAFHYMD